MKNGVYAFSVAAVDTVGNIGNSKTELIILNKFEPSTYISSISQFTDEMGGTTLTINGGGFTYDGTISKIYIDQDGQAPYDVTLKLANNQFKVNSDSKITQVIVETDVQEGNYKIGLHHTDRGVYFSNKIIKITQSGTIKIESEYVPQKYFAIENYSLLN
ncbi:MAG: IPT/TIG domain-containing protein, partial [Treponema sp.]|nr:IPT/TIG domain-containing protein [Treponema sp.]